MEDRRRKLLRLQTQSIQHFGRSSGISMRSSNVTINENVNINHHHLFNDINNCNSLELSTPTPSTTAVPTSMAAASPSTTSTTATHSDVMPNQSRQPPHRTPNLSHVAPAIIIIDESAVSVNAASSVSATAKAADAALNYGSNYDIETPSMISTVRPHYTLRE